jgi:arabinofuranosyltransferase
MSPISFSCGSKKTLLFSIVICLFTIAGLWGFDNHHRYDTDDAYITYRYAQNLADGLGFTYNAAEKVIGTTTPLYTGMLTAAHMLGFTIPAASHFLNLFFAGLSLALVFALVAYCTGLPLLGLVASAFAGSMYYFVIFSVSGMETSLYLFLILSTFLLYADERFKLSAFTAALTALTRLDGMIVGAALVLHYFLARRRFPSRGIVLSFILPLLPWFLFAWLYTGSIFPQSMLGKEGHQLAASRLWCLEALINSPATVSVTLLALIAGCLVYFFPVLFVAARGLQVLTTWVVLYVLAFTLQRIDLYQWYLMPLFVGIAALAASALTVFNVLAQPPSARARLKVRITQLCVAIVVLLTILRQSLPAVKAEIDWTNSVEGGRAAIADTIATLSTAGDIICTGAIGVVGWRTGLYVWDQLALVTRTKIGQCPEKYRWLITEGAAPSAPEITGLKVIKSQPTIGPHFYLYERGDLAPAQIIPTGDWIIFDKSLRIIKPHITGDNLHFSISTEEKQMINYKVFVHVMRGSEVIKQYDFYPEPTIAALQPNLTYSITKQLPDLPRDSKVVIGFFNENDPDYSRLALANGETSVAVE